MGKNSILGNQYKIDNKNTTMIKSNSLTATQIAWGLLHKISEIPRFANVLYLDGWSVQYFNGPKKHSWEDFLKRLNEVQFLSCSSMFSIE